MPSNPTPKPTPPTTWEGEPSMQERVASLEARLSSLLSRLDGIDSRKERRRRTEAIGARKVADPIDPVDLVTVGPVAQLRRQLPVPPL